MRHYPQTGAIHVENIRLWAHVGFLDHERLHGQLFTVDFSIWLNLEEASRTDDLEDTADYSLAIKAIQEMAFQLNCKTIEYFSEQIFMCLESLYGRVPTKITLTKCNPPVEGFPGTVAVERFKNWPSS